MATSQQMRTMYPEHIVKWPTSSKNPVCSYSGTVLVRFLAVGPSYPRGFINLKFHAAIAPWARAIASVMLYYGYAFEETAGGTVNCRKITGLSWRTSLHAHAVALDINPSKNKYRVSVGLIQFGKMTDMPKVMITAIESILTLAGLKTSQWGGRWWNVKDPMHFQPSKCTRTELELGIDVATVEGWNAYLVWAGLVEDDVLRLGDNDDLVKWYQAMLNVEGANPKLGVDGDFGPKTQTAVMDLERRLGRVETGQIGDPLGGYLSSYSRRYENDELTPAQGDARYAPKNHGPHSGGEHLTIEEVALAFSPRGHGHSGTVSIPEETP